MSEFLISLFHCCSEGGCGNNLRGGYPSYLPPPYADIRLTALNGLMEKTVLRGSAAYSKKRKFLILAEGGKKFTI